jgi:hypothetical protein
LRSLAPLVDEIVVAVGDSTDGCEKALADLAAQLSCPVKTFSSPWEAAAHRGGAELSRQTNLALQATRGDVAFYLQADEIVHEEDYPKFRRDLEQFKNDSSLDALAFEYVHFYGTFDTVAYSRHWYRREVRALKTNRNLKSFGDAQGFRIQNADGTWSKPKVALSTARIFHYGWVRPPQTMAAKSNEMDRLWQGTQLKSEKHTSENVYPPQYGLRPFEGTHPLVMQERVRDFQKNFPNFSPFENVKLKWDKRDLKAFGAAVIEKISGGWRPGEWQNFEIVKRYK